MARTNEVLFASVTRDTFEILGLFDHAAFEHDINGAMTPERTRLALCLSRAFVGLNDS